MQTVESADIGLTRGVLSKPLVVPNFLSGYECELLVQLCEVSGFQRADVRTAEGQRAMPAIRNNDRTVVEDSGWVQLLWDRLSQISLPALEDKQAIGLPKALRFYRYGPGQRFKMHKDGPWHENGYQSQVTFLVYLNENFKGGETGFRDFVVKPETGSALLFAHDTWHEGAAVIEGTKYVLRSDILYG